MFLCIRRGCIRGKKKDKVINGAPKSSRSTKEVHKEKEQNFRNSSLKELIDATMVSIDAQDWRRWF